MVNKLDFEDRIKQELTAKAKEVEISDFMFNKIKNRIETDTKGNKEILKYKFHGVIMRQWVVISLTLLLAIGGVMFTFSSDIRAATLAVVDKIRTIFVLEEFQGEYKIVEKTTKDKMFAPVCCKTTMLSDAEIASKIGFELTFPEKLSGGYKLCDKAEEVGINKIVSEETIEKLESDMIKAINDEKIFDSLSQYNPYRDVFAVYSKDGNDMFISMRSLDAITVEQGYRDISTAIETSVGDTKALWIEVTHANYRHISENGVGKSDLYTKPDGITKKHILTWDYNGVTYEISTCLESELTMDEALKLAEDFMKAQ